MVPRAPRLLLQVALAASLAACGAADPLPVERDGDAAPDAATLPDTGAHDAIVAGDSSSAIDTAPGERDAPAADAGSSYPSGPYGSAVGSVVADLALEGYVRFGTTTGLATSAAYGAASFGELRAKSPRRYAVVHVSGFT
jgi:hypothetical protein